MTFLSKRVQSIPQSGIRVFFDLVMSSKGIISLGVGEPDFFTPWNIREEAIYRIQNGLTTYTSNRGLEALRIEVSSYLKNKYNINYTKDELLITNGVSEAVDIVARSFIDPGDEIILPEPAYVCYRPLVELCDGVIVPVDTSLTGFSLTAAAVEKMVTPKTKAIFLCYPNNPTGQSIDFDELVQIAELSKKHNFMIITDEIYADLSFGSFQSIAALPDIKDRLIYLNGFSKAHSMTGWRIGYIAAPEYLVESMNKIHQYSALCAPTISQYAAIEACRGSDGDVEKMRKSYQQRAQYFTDQMNSVGLTTIMPQGGLYCFSSIKSLKTTSLAFAESLLADANVAVVPGNVFGESGEGYFRSCIATDFNQLKIAAQKIIEFVRKQ
ncbi:MAG: aminotransferase class I/II-fold pyridoxal phosphate-dependent enzyme [Candidatus Margulisiibacteriota bacterium]